MTVSYTIGAKDLPAALQRVLNKAPRAVLVKANRRTAARTIAIVSAGSPVDLGLYRARWAVDNIPDGAILFNDAPYAAVLELGSRPHRPPFGAILAWAQRKAGGIILMSTGQPLASRKGGRPASSSTHTAGEQANIYAFAMAVVKKIEREGTKPRFIMRGALPRSKDILRQETLRALGEIR